MAYPRVFISSTCYDLREIRDVLFDFIHELLYIPVLSDKGDVFYHPDIHTHDSCINEIETCQLFVLIIGGRFGGKYKADPNKSIVNAEYECAKRLNLPIITFISREVYEDHRVYVRNRQENGEKFKSIIYPSIEKQSHAINIFEFIDDVRKSDFNNAIFPFEFGREIIKCLKQQWAGMFYEFLRTRKNNREVEKTNKLLSDLTMISEKTEEILNKVYNSVDKENAASEIAKIDITYDAKRFLVTLSEEFKNFPKAIKDVNKYIQFNTKLSFVDFLKSTGDFKQIQDEISYTTHTQHFKSLIFKSISNGYLIIAGEMTNSDISVFEKFEKLYDDYRKVSAEQRQKILLSMM